MNEIRWECRYCARAFVHFDALVRHWKRERRQGLEIKSMKCFDCDKPLNGGIDTYGDVGEELCWDCYAERNAEANTDFWYGLGPHKHAYDKQGNIIIGGTTFDEITAPMVDGAYDFGDRTFTPDPEAEGCGVWRMKSLAGWR